MILVGSNNIEEARSHFASIEPVAEIYNPYAMPYENRPILRARGLKGNLRTLAAVEELELKPALQAHHGLKHRVD